MDMATSITATLGEDIRVQSSGSQDKLGSVMAQVADRKAELEEEIERYLHLSRVVSGQIEEVEIPRYRDILYLRYVCCSKFEGIAVTMNISWRQTIRLHGKALLEFERKYHRFFEKMS